MHLYEAGRIKHHIVIIDVYIVYVTAAFHASTFLCSVIVGVRTTPIVLTMELMTARSVLVLVAVMALLLLMVPASVTMMQALLRFEGFIEGL